MDHIFYSHVNVIHSFCRWFRLCPFHILGGAYVRESHIFLPRRDSIELLQSFFSFLVSFYALNRLSLPTLSSSNAYGVLVSLLCVVEYIEELLDVCVLQVCAGAISSTFSVVSTPFSSTTTTTWLWSRCCGGRRESTMSSDH